MSALETRAPRDAGTPERRPRGDRPRGRNRRPRGQGRLAAVLLLPAVLAVFGIVIYPVLRTLFVSFFAVDSALDVATPFVGLDNYATILSNSSYWSAMGRTLYFTLVSTGLELVLGLGLAYLLNARIRGRWLLCAVVVTPWAVPTIVNAALWKGIFNAQYGALNGVLTDLGLIDQYHAWLGDPFLALNMVILADAWKTTPLVAIFLLAGLTTIPKELYEAARVDRASPWRIFRSITLPMLVPSIAIVVVLRTVEAFKVFDIIYGMTRGGPANGTQTIAYYAYTIAFSNQQLGIGAAISYLIVIVILLLTVFYLRLLRRSEMSLL